MEHRLHQNEIATCGSESYAGQNPTQQALCIVGYALAIKCHTACTTNEQRRYKCIGYLKTNHGPQRILENIIF